MGDNVPLEGGHLSGPGPEAAPASSCLPCAPSTIRPEADGTFPGRPEKGRGSGAGGWLPSPLGSGLWALGSWVLGWVLGAATTDTPGSGSKNNCLQQGWLCLGRPAGAGGLSFPGRAEAQCHVFTAPGALQGGCPWGPQGRGARVSQAAAARLGVGGPAGPAARLAIVPVAAEVHLDGQGAVGARLVLAAVIWRRDTMGDIEHQDRTSPPPHPTTPTSLFLN